MYKKFVNIQVEKIDFVRSSYDTPYSKAYVLEWESKLNLGLNTATNNVYIKKCFKKIVEN